MFFLRIENTKVTSYQPCLLSFQSIGYNIQTGLYVGRNLLSPTCYDITQRTQFWTKLWKLVLKIYTYRETQKYWPAWHHPLPNRRALVISCWCSPFISLSSEKSPFDFISILYTSPLGVNLHFLPHMLKAPALHELSPLMSAADATDQVTAQYMFLIPVPTIHTFHRHMASVLP